MAVGGLAGCRTYSERRADRISCCSGCGEEVREVCRMMPRFLRAPPSLQVKNSLLWENIPFAPPAGLCVPFLGLHTHGLPSIASRATFAVCIPRGSEEFLLWCDGSGPSPPWALAPLVNESTGGTHGLFPQGWLLSYTESFSLPLPV